MIPIHQTILADPDRNDGHNADGIAGNCYQAALASALELPLDEVPHFSNMDNDVWWDASNAWLWGRGYVRGVFDDSPTRGCPPVADCPWPCTLDRLLLPDDYPECDRVVAVLGCGPSPRGPFRHVVILDPETGRMLHDPHPSGAGVTEVDELELIFSIAVFR